MDVIVAIFKPITTIHHSVKFALMQKKTDAAVGETRNSALLCIAACSAEETKHLIILSVACLSFLLSRITRN